MRAFTLFYILLYYINDILCPRIALRDTSCDGECAFFDAVFSMSYYFYVEKKRLWLNKKACNCLLALFA